MRAEVKVALIVGVVAIAGGAIWWFSGSRNELEYLPIDKPAMDATAPGDPALAGDATPGSADSRRSGESSLDQPGRTSPTAPPARRTTPPLRPSGQTEPQLDQPPVTARPGAEPGEQPSPFDQPLAVDPAAKPIETLTPADEPPARDASTEVDRARPPDSPPPAVTPPRLREPLARAYKTYTIQRGDRLIDLAREEYGDGALWQAIKAVNPDLDENSLKIGAVIKLPALAEAQRLLRSTAEEAADGPAPTPPGERERPDAAQATYVVEAGDTLTKIARNVLNDDTRWREIFELNRDQLESADLIRPGMVLRLPPVEKESE